MTRNPSNTQQPSSVAGGNLDKQVQQFGDLASGIPAQHAPTLTIEEMIVASGLHRQCPTPAACPATSDGGLVGLALAMSIGGAYLIYRRQRTALAEAPGAVPGKHSHYLLSREELVDLALELSRRAGIPITRLMRRLQRRKGGCAVRGDKLFHSHGTNR